MLMSRSHSCVNYRVLTTKSCNVGSIYLISKTNLDIEKKCLSPLCLMIVCDILSFNTKIPCYLVILCLAENVSRDPVTSVMLTRSRSTKIVKTPSHSNAQGQYVMDLHNPCTIPELSFHSEDSLSSVRFPLNAHLFQITYLSLFFSQNHLI